MADSDWHVLLKQLRDNSILKFLSRHLMLGFSMIGLGIVLLIALLGLNDTQPELLRETGWSALFAIPATFVVTGLLTVAYETSIRTAYIDALKGISSAWDSGVIVLPTHKHAPDRREVLDKARINVRLMLTTLFHYLEQTNTLVEKKVAAGVVFKIILYDPDSQGLKDKAQEEGFPEEHFRNEIIQICQEYLGPMHRHYPKRVQVRFCNFNTPFGVTIIDDREMVLSLNIYGLARSNNVTPCLVIQNRYDPDSVFKIYEEAFEKIWARLDQDKIPKSVAAFFSGKASTSEQQAVNVPRQ